MNAISTQAAAATVRNGIAAGRQQQKRSSMSGAEARTSLLVALAAQSASLSQRLVSDLISETAKYVVPRTKRFEAATLEEAFMSVPDIETLNFKVLATRDTDHYQIREIQPYYVALTTMPASPSDFYSASRSFNVLAQYLFGQNVARESMEMTTPVITRRAASDGEIMEMTTPVITAKVQGQDKWEMSFIMPSRYGPNLPLPKDSSVRIKEVPNKVAAVAAFSGYVTDEEVEKRELKLRKSLEKDKDYKVKAGVQVEVAQYNPPFTLPFTRRNEIALEVERRAN